MVPNQSSVYFALALLHFFTSQVCPAEMTFDMLGHSHVVPRQSNVYFALAFLHFFFILVLATALSLLALYVVAKRLGKYSTNALLSSLY